MTILKTKKGFTLTELIIVIAIVGILAAVLIPSLSGYIEKSRKSALEQEAKAISTIYETWLLEPDVVDGEFDAENDPTVHFNTYYSEITKKDLSESFEITLESLKPSGFTYTKGDYKATYTNGGILKVEPTTTQP